MKQLSSIFLLLFIFNIYGFAQSFDEIAIGDEVSISLKDGTKLSGQIIDMETEAILVSTKSLGEIKVNLSSIKKINLGSINFTEEEDGEFDFENPLYTKYFVSETAIGLKKGQAYYQNLLLGGNIFSYGITDQISVTGGFESVSLFLGEGPTFLLGAKFTSGGRNTKLHFGGGGNLLARVNDDVNFGSLYGIVTYGNTNHNITGGIGIGYFDSDFAELPVIQLGGQTRFSENWGIVMDYLILVDNGDLGGVGSLAVRYITKKVALDFGLFTFFGEGSLPIAAAAIRF